MDGGNTWSRREDVAAIQGMSAMVLNRSFGDAQFIRNLLVEASLGDERADLAFAFGQEGQTGLRCGQKSSLRRMGRCGWSQETEASRFCRALFERLEVCGQKWLDPQITRHLGDLGDGYERISEQQLACAFQAPLPQKSERRRLSVLPKCRLDRLHTRARQSRQVIRENRSSRVRVNVLLNQPHDRATRRRGRFVEQIRVIMWHAAEQRA